jgi:ABC-type multidrug transport system fused ATPase/permease subunit
MSLTLRTAFRSLTLRLVGPAGTLLYLVASAAWLAQAVVEWVIALLLLKFLHATGLLRDAALPEWLPGALLDQGSIAVWTELALLAALQSGLQIVSFQSRILLSERAQMRLRAMLAFRAFVLEGVPPPLSRMTYYTAEVFPRAAGALFHGVHVSCLLAQALALAAAMCWVAPGAAMVALGGLAAFGVLVLRFNEMNSRASARLLAAQDVYERSKVRLSRNWLLIRVLGLARREYLGQLDACAEYHRQRVIGFFFANLGTALGPVLAVLTLAAVVLVHQVWVGGSGAALLAFLYLLFRFQQMVAGASYVIGDIFGYGAHVREAAAFTEGFSDEHWRQALLADRGWRLRARPAPLRELVPDSGPPGAATPQPPSIDVRDLSFAWPGSASPVFSGIEVELPAGRQLAITGPNGAGKSSFLAVLVGVLPAAGGRAHLGGMEGAAWMARHRAAVGFVGPEPYLVLGTLRENLVYGLERRPGDAELMTALERSGLAARVRALADGLEHRIGESGEGFSAGENQKVAIARALLRDPRLLILDEPTAHVDADSERDVAEMLRSLKGRCTVVVVSHKPGLLRHADRVLELFGDSTRPEAAAAAARAIGSER